MKSSLSPPVPSPGGGGFELALTLPFCLFIQNARIKTVSFSEGKDEAGVPGEEVGAEEWWSGLSETIPT